MKNDAITRFIIEISGNMHRVGYRHYCLCKARDRNLKGFAMYTSGGIVIEVQGKITDLQDFINWCRKGPDGCIVEQFDLAEAPVHSNQRENQLFLVRTSDFKSYLKQVRMINKSSFFQFSSIITL